MPRLLFIPLVLVSTLALCQDNATDSQTLRSMLTEIRLLRRDLETSSVAAQRVQIALYRLQLQNAAVEHATRLVDEAHEKLADLADQRRKATEGLEQVENERDKNQDVHERKFLEEQAIPQLKKHLNEIANNESQWQAKSSEAEAQLKTEQLKLDGLHGVLDELDRTLQRIGQGSASFLPAQR